MAVLGLDEHDDGVVLVRWDDGENRFDLTSVGEWHAVLDDLEGRSGPLAVVITGAGKFFSNGLDLGRFSEAPHEAGPIVDGVHRLFGRLLLLPAWTVFAINGHAFAAGAMMTATGDARLMRTERGYWCVPEVDLGLPLTTQMTAVLSARLPAPAVARCMLTGGRLDAPSAHRMGIVDEAVPAEDLLERAVGQAAPMAAKDRSVIANHKRQLFGAAARTCGIEP